MRDSRETESRQLGEEIDNPQHLWQEDADQRRGCQERALEPKRRQREEKSCIAEIEEILRTVIAPINRHQDGEKTCIPQLEPERQPRLRGKEATKQCRRSVLAHNRLRGTMGSERIIPGGRRGVSPT